MKRVFESMWHNVYFSGDRDEGYVAKRLSSDYRESEAVEGACKSLSDSPLDAILTGGCVQRVS